MKNCTIDAIEIERHETDDNSSVDIVNTTYKETVNFVIAILIIAKRSNSIGNNSVYV